MSVNAGPISANTGLMQAEVNRHRSNSADLGPTSVDVEPKLVPSGGQLWSMLVDVGQTLVELEPNLAEFCTKPVEVGPLCADSGPHWPSLVPVVPNLGILCPKSTAVDRVPSHVGGALHVTGNATAGSKTRSPSCCAPSGLQARKALAGQESH